MEGTEQQGPAPRTAGHRSPRGHTWSESVDGPQRQPGLSPLCSLPALGQGPPYSANESKLFPFGAYARRAATGLSLPFSRQRPPWPAPPAQDAGGKVHPAMWQGPRQLCLAVPSQNRAAPLVGAGPADHRCPQPRVPLLRSSRDPLSTPQPASPQRLHRSGRARLPTWARWGEGEDRGTEGEGGRGGPQCLALCCPTVTLS